MTGKPLQSTLNLFQLLNDASIDRVMAIDLRWKVISWNSTSELLSGIKMKEVEGLDLREIFPQLKDDDEIMKAYHFAMEGKKSFLPAKKGLFNRDHYENHFIPLRDEDGHIIGVMNIMHDVAHRIKAERELQKLNFQLKEKYQQLERANTELATFTSITGNDLKEPIKKIYTALELIAINDGSRLSDSSRAALRRMQGSINRINLLLEDILSMSAINGINSDFATIDPRQIIHEVMADMHAKMKEKQAIIDIQSLPAIHGSRKMLKTLFHNLLDNALKFQPAGNTPRISITGDEVSDKAGSTGDETEYTCINISDNGIGFSQQEAEKIFTMFERLLPRTDFPGSGVGLTICRKIMDAHGGRITAESTPGNGATFRCYFPK